MNARLPVRSPHRLVSTLATIVFFGIAGCAPAAPAPTSAPPKPAPTAAPAKAQPAATQAPAAKPAATAPAPKPAEGKATAAPASPAAKAEAKPVAKVAPPADWQAQWDTMLAAAKREGTVQVCCSSNGPQDEAINQFAKAYPEIRLDLHRTRSTDLPSRMFAERDAGQYLYDALALGSSSQRSLKPRGVLEPVRPALVLPEVLDDSKWLGGFDAGWSDNEQQFVYMFQGSLGHTCWVNRDVAPEGQLKSYQDLLDPRWKGRMVWQEPRLGGGSGGGNAGHLLAVLGEDYLRKLFAQDVVITNDNRQQVEWLVRGVYPIGCGLTTTILLDFKEQGLGQNVHPLEPSTQVGDRIDTGSGGIYLVNRSPHPNAAKVFANWIISKAGQTAWATLGLQVSRRLDVLEGPADRRPDPNVKLLNLSDEASLKFTTRANEIAKEVLK